MFPFLFGASCAQLKTYCLEPVLTLCGRLLEESRVQSTLAKPNTFKRPRRPYSLWVTVMTFLTQCLGDDHSCRTAVATAKDRSWLPEDASPDTGAYCRARDDLCPDGLKTVVCHTGTRLDNQVAAQDLWLGRRVRVVDGTGITLPDTAANQAAYPQPSQQKPGCGFPVLKLVALMSLATGAILQYASGSLHAGDQRLFQALRASLTTGDVVLGDRAFGTFAIIALLLQQGVDAVFRLHQCRKTDFHKGIRLGKHDHLITWERTSWPKWLVPTAILPETLCVREVYFRVLRPGFRPQAITLVTTLLDPKLYPPTALAALFLRRWEMELWLRHIKTTMDMEMLRTKTPKRVRAELAMFLIAYNLVRTVMLDAAQAHTLLLPRLSFRSALVRLRLWCARQAQQNDPIAWLDGYTRLLRDLARDVNPHRPGRVEPRVIKRRPKPFPLMTKPRQQLREALLHG